MMIIMKSGEKNKKVYKFSKPIIQIINKKRTLKRLKMMQSKKRVEMKDDIHYYLNYYKKHSFLK